MKCYDCPRICGADRAVRAGVCGGGASVRIALTVRDFRLEEPCLGRSVTAVFFSGCSLGCSYCQNRDISRNAAAGKEYGDRALAELFDSAPAPIDLVTPTHYLTAIERAAAMTVKPHSYIYNTSGYETELGVERAKEFTSVFLTDFKYADEYMGRRFSRAPDYAETAIKALRRMRSVKDVWKDDGAGGKTLERGLIVRHLVLPGFIQNTLDCLDIIAEEVGTDTVISLMSQFTPNGFGEPNARLKRIEYKIAVEHALAKGFKTGYTQDYSSACAEFTPEFDIK